MEETEFEYYVRKYRETFDDQFPTAAIGNEEGCIILIKQCLAKGKPYELDVSEGIYY